VFGKFPFSGWSRGWYAEDTENNVSENAKSLAFKQDIMRTVSGAVEMSRIIKKNRYDEKVIVVDPEHNNSNNIGKTAAHDSVSL
jgi:hypothetical protein